MIKEFKKSIIGQINQSTGLKKKLLWLFDFYIKYRPFVVGAFVRNPAYILHVFSSKVIARPGTLSFGGIFNPGALQINSEIMLLANGQKVPWFKARGKKKEFYLQGNPVVLTLPNSSQKVMKERVIYELMNIPKDQDYALEDFRLFWWKGKMMCNHSLVIRKIYDDFIGQTGSRSALSVLDIKKNTLHFCGVPKVDFTIQKFEKNWVYKETEKDLLMFYSVSPFRVLKLENEEKLSFKTVINQNVSNQLKDPGGFGTLVSFSTNPIDYDEKHWFGVIHQIQHKITGRCYYHWAILISKETWMPTSITSKPIFSGNGARGRLPGIRYISSVLKIEEELLFFAGEGDVYVTLTKRKRKEMEKLFVNI